MRVVPIPALLLILQVAALPARSEDPSNTATGAAPSPVGLDALMRLPAQTPTPQQKKLDLGSDGNAWQMAVPGAGANAENSPVSYKLRQDIRRQRGEVAEAERALQELRIEANLAGVPEDWQD